jgi:hypothetical protein
MVIKILARHQCHAIKIPMYIKEHKRFFSGLVIAGTTLPDTW